MSSNPFTAVRGMKFIPKVKHLWKQAWNEIPEVMACSPYFILGLAGAGYIHYRIMNTENKTARFKDRYIIMRPNDPQVTMLKRDETSPPYTKTPTIC